MEILILEWGHMMHPIIFQNVNEYKGCKGCERCERCEGYERCKGCGKCKRCEGYKGYKGSEAGTKGVRWA